MELFSLLAKLTLDAKDFQKGIEEAKDEASNFDIDEPTLELDDDPFYHAVDEAENTDVEDPEKPELGLNTDGFDSGIEEAESKGETFASSMKGIFDELGGLLVTTGIVAAITGIVSSLKEGIELAGKTGDAIDKQSQKMGISAKAYQEWSYALELSGASIDDLNRGLRTWQKSIGDSEQMAKLGEAFTALGIDAENAFSQIEKGENLDTLLSQTLFALADRSGGDRGYLATLLFGNSANKLNALLNSTSGEIRGMVEEANDLGLIMTDEEVKNAAAYTDATTRLNQSVEALKTSFVKDLMPIITEAINGLAKIVAFFNWRGGSDNSLADYFDEIDKKGTEALRTSQQNEAEAKNIVERIGELGDYFTLDDKGKKTYDALLAELIELYPKLDDAVQKNKNYISENTEAVEAQIEAWAKLEREQILSQTLAEKKLKVAEQYAIALDKAGEAEVYESRAMGQRADAMDALNDIFKTHSDLSDAFYGQFGTRNVNESNAYDALYWYRNENKLYAGGTQAQEDMIDAYLDTKEAAAVLRAEANGLEEDAKQAEADLAVYAQSLSEKLGMTEEKTDTATQAVNELKEAIDSLPSSKIIDIGVGWLGKIFGRAIGDAYIPFDNFPALLHRGEKVLTATEARQDSGNTGEIVGAISGLRSDLQKLQLVVNGKTFGRAVVNYGGERVDDYLGSSESKVYAGYGT